MKRRLLAMLVCFTLTAQCYGCGTSYQEASAETKDIAMDEAMTIYGNYFTVITKWTDGVGGILRCICE